MSDVKILFSVFIFPDSRPDPVLPTQKISTMPYKENEMCLAPSDPQITIWRYMDLAKFLSLIDKSSLFFIRVDKLVSQDPYEGLFTHLNVQIGNTKFPLFEQVKHDVIYHIEKEKKTHD